MGRGLPPTGNPIKRAVKKQTRQIPLFSKGPAIIYRGCGQETTASPAFIFNDNGEERFIVSY
jgi:hypothetical protein